MNHDANLRLQAYLDGELAGPEAAEVQTLLANDREAQALFAELQGTRSSLAGHEADIKLPETREFFWSKISREIATLEPPVPQAPKITWVTWLGRQLMPLSGVALLALLISVFVLHPPGATGQVTEMEVGSDEMGAYTFRDQAHRMTMVWFYDRTDNSQFTTQPPLAIVDPE